MNPFLSVTPSLLSCNLDWGWGDPAVFKKNLGKSHPSGSGSRLCWCRAGGGRSPSPGQLCTAHTQQCFGFNGLPEASFPFLLQTICLESYGPCIYLCRLGPSSRGHPDKAGPGPVTRSWVSAAAPNWPSPPCNLCTQQSWEPPEMRICCWELPCPVPLAFPVLLGMKALLLGTASKHPF